MKVVIKRDTSKSIGLKEANDKTFAMLREAYNKEYKQHSPARQNLSKKEDIAFVRAQKKRIIDRRRAINP